MTPPNPLASLMAGRPGPNAAPPMAGPGGPSGANPNAVGQQIAQQLSQVGEADPDTILKMIDQMKQQIVQMVPRVAMRIPGMTNHLMSMMKALDGAKGEASKAKQVMETVGGGQGKTAFNSPPLGMAAARPGGGAPPGPGLPSIGG